MIKKCKICGWNKGITHLHHIIPRKNFGDDSSKNLIRLCPNHHSEAHYSGIENFNTKYNLTGKKISEKQLKILKAFSILKVFGYCDDDMIKKLPFTYHHYIEVLKDKKSFDKIKTQLKETYIR